MFPCSEDRISATTMRRQAGSAVVGSSCVQHLSSILLIL
ncbi:Uncharacterized protein BM_BM683 [Brugia malayi]|uniref:Bm683 n=1 Tax=Brugia malayi TaxID=6279 RepID=A0A4E9ERU5_BRUMA|nr:Uncharacterized protein BM_BM683 [Brugia malayi]CRZ25751.1 Bm683 [Brugia malayi]VIO86302.1 Uncharacterized protein BM_BM683 [Brugia malayi]